MVDHMVDLMATGGGAFGNRMQNRLAARSVGLMEN